jgi:hypothetical protein
MSLALAGLAFWAGILAVEAFPECRAPAAEPAVFEMKEASALAHGYVRGQAVSCASEPNEQVKAYPKLKSKKPYYGVVAFDRNYLEPDSGIEFQFVIDESGESADADETAKDDAEKEETPSLLDMLSSALLGKSKTPEPPKVVPNVITYDRLYIDSNRDLDLTNDPVLKPMKSPPPGAMLPYSGKQNVVFDFVSVPLDRGPDEGTGPFRVVPRLYIQEYEGVEYAQVDFAAAMGREGRIKIGSREYDARLGHQYVVSGRFDRPYTAVFLTALDGSEIERSGLSREMLGSMRLVDGKYYSLAASPAGDKLFVEEYDGGLGVFQIGSGKRDVQGGFNISGALRASDMRTLPVGQANGSSDSADRCEVPVGEYCFDYSTIQFGGLRISLSNNYHLDGGPRERTKQPPVYAVKIREEKPFVLDFSNEPEVLFASPGKDATFAPGEEIEVKAVLIDRELDIMIRRLYEKNVSLDPDVTISDSSGKEVGGGKLPFG